jgi:hypothetical protein
LGEEERRTMRNIKKEEGNEIEKHLNNLMQQEDHSRKINVSNDLRL